jgi:hypothetical protein
MVPLSSPPPSSAFVSETEIPWCFACNSWFDCGTMLMTFGPRVSSDNATNGRRRATTKTSGRPFSSSDAAGPAR